MKLKRTSSTVYIFSETPAIEKSVNVQIHKNLMDGETLFHSNGSKEFIIDEPILNPENTGSEQFIWDKSGNKVKHNRIKHTVSKSGEHKTEIMKTVFKGM